MDWSNGSLTLSFNPAVSAHLLGGAVMGKACDFDGRVERHLGLYVVNGALIEGSNGPNPPPRSVEQSGVTPNETRTRCQGGVNRLGQSC